MWRIIGAVVGTLMLLIGVAYVLFMGRGVVKPAEKAYEFVLRPASPRDASYRFGEKEVRFQDGKGGRDGVAYLITDQSATGDLNDDGLSDEVLCITGTGSYLAAAFRDKEGYVGLNALPLPEGVECRSPSIAYGLVTLAGGTSEGTPMYFGIVGAEFLQLPAVSASERMLSGTLRAHDDILYFSECGAGEREVSRTSHSYAALNAVYGERVGASSTRPFLVIVSSDTGSSSDLVIERILKAPREGACDAKGF